MNAPRWIWGTAFAVSAALHLGGLFAFGVTSRPLSAKTAPAVVLQSDQLFIFKAKAVKPTPATKPVKPAIKTVTQATATKSTPQKATRQRVKTPAVQPVAKRLIMPASQPKTATRIRPAIVAVKSLAAIVPIKVKTIPPVAEPVSIGIVKKPLLSKPEKIRQKQKAVQADKVKTSPQSSQPQPQPQPQAQALTQAITNVKKAVRPVRANTLRVVTKPAPNRIIATVRPVTTRPALARPSKTSAKTVARQKLAALPPAARPVARPVPETEKPRLKSKSDILAQYVSSYQGGRCFYALPLKLAGPVPQIIGFGASIPAFLEFSGALEKHLGVTPQIGMRMVSRAQCPVVDFTQAMLTNKAPQVDIFLKSAKISNGKVLHGIVGKVDFQHLAILLVDDEGMVHNIAGYTRRTDRGIEFNPQVFGTGDGRSRVQLIVVISSQQPLPVLQGNDVRSSDDVFPLLLQQIKNAPGAIKMGLRAFVVR